MELTVVDHPLAARLLTRLRDETTDRAAFRLAMDELAGMLVYEACRTLPTEPVDVTTPMGPAHGVTHRRPPLVVPVLRAGLGLHGAVLRLLPDTDTAFIGVSRNEETLEPEPYMNSVPADLAGRPVLVLDPMLATGGSLARLPGPPRPRRGPPHRRVRARRARGPRPHRAVGAGRAGGDRASTSGWTSGRSSSPASATPATASSARRETDFHSCFESRVPRNGESPTPRDGLRLR